MRSTVSWFARLAGLPVLLGLTGLSGGGVFRLKKV